MKDKKFKEPFKCGQVWRSKEHPHVDFIIDAINYYRIADTEYDFNLFSYICWQIANETAFNKKVCEVKKVSSLDELRSKGLTTHPYPSFGENKIKSLQQKIKKYNMYLDETRTYKSTFKKDNDSEYIESIVVFGAGKFAIDYECRDGVYGVYKD